MSCFRTCSMTTCGAVALWASAAVSWICARYPASVIATTFRRRTRAASCDTAMPTMNNTANVVTSDDVRMVNRPYGTVKKKSNQIAAQTAARAPASPLPIAATATTTTTRSSATSVSAQLARQGTRMAAAARGNARAATIATRSLVR